jgi:toxin ParE1/3/4
VNAYRLTPRARYDVREIWAYTVSVWGRRAADRYIRELTKTFEAIAKDPIHGASVEDMDCRKQVFPSHVIFYGADRDEIIVVRVLHQQMDTPSHLA